MEVFVGLVIGALIGAVISGVIIWIVGKLNMGLSVDNFGWAMLAGLFIGVITTLVTHFVPNLDGIVGAVVHLIVSAVVILLAGKAFSGVKVDGFSGALLAAVIMALVGFGLALLFGGVAATVA